MKSTQAQAAHDAFQATLREKGCRLDQAQVDKAWEAAVAAIIPGDWVRLEPAEEP